MPKITWKISPTEEITAEVKTGMTLMEAAVSNNVPRVIGECGGIWLAPPVMLLLQMNVMTWLVNQTILRMICWILPRQREHKTAVCPVRSGLLMNWMDWF